MIFAKNVDLYRGSRYKFLKNTIFGPTQGQEIDFSTFFGEPSGMVGNGIWGSENAKKRDFRAPQCPDIARWQGRRGGPKNAFFGAFPGFSPTFRPVTQPGGFPAFEEPWRRHGEASRSSFGRFYAILQV